MSLADPVTRDPAPAPADRSTTRLRTATRVPAALVAAVALGVVLVAVGAVLDHTTVGDRAGQADVALGLPLAWVHQDQSAVHPPLPHRAGLTSPWESPVRLDGLAWTLDVLAVSVLLVLLLLVGAAARWLLGQRRVLAG